MIRINTVLRCDYPGCMETYSIIGYPWGNVLSKLLHAHGWARRQGKLYCATHKWKHARSTAESKKPDVCQAVSV